MDLGELHELVTSYDGVTRTTRAGRARWQLRGRLVARELDDAHVLVRVPFDARDLLLRQHPEVFSVPQRFRKHMLVAVDLDADSPDLVDAVTDAVTSAWELQRDG